MERNEPTNEWMTFPVLGRPVLFRITEPAGRPRVTNRYRDLPPAARRLMFTGEGEAAFERMLDLAEDLLGTVAPLWVRGLSTPEQFALEQAGEVTELSPWVARIAETFLNHTVHWYHVAHVLTQIIRQLGKARTDWSEVVYLLQAGGPFFEKVITRLLPEVKDHALRARLLNALLFFPTPAAIAAAEKFLPDTVFTDTVGCVSLIRTLEKFDFPMALTYRETYPVYARLNAPLGVINAGHPDVDPGVLRAAWWDLRTAEYTNQSVVRYLLSHPDVRIEQLVEACEQRPDWLELLGRFRTDFLAAGYTGELVPSLDEFVLTNLDRYKWPTGERHHNRVDPEVRHALYQEALGAEVFARLEGRLSDKDNFRRSNAAMHLAAYAQLPRILAHRQRDGTLRFYFQEPPETRPALPAVIVAKLLELIVEDRRITAYNFAARAVSQLLLDPVHGPGVTEYLLARVGEERDVRDLVFCCYLFLPTLALHPRRAEIGALLPAAIAAVKPAAWPAFGRLLCQLYDPVLTAQFLAKVAPAQTGQVYAIFEELAQAVNLLWDERCGLPLAMFHPEWGGGPGPQVRGGG